MRELFLTEGESTRTSLVFHTAGEGDAVESFFLAVDDKLRDLLKEVVEPADAAQLAADNLQPEDAGEDPGDLADTQAAEPAAEGAETDTPKTDTADMEEAAADQVATDETATDETAGDKAAGEADKPREHAAKRGTLPAPDPRRTAPLSMRPREIQDRIRGGASAAELAEEMGVTESRVEPFAHPVLLERQRMAELAKKTHPVREDGPARLTLWEVLATAFAARSNSLADATWDSYRDTAGQWVIRVRWSAGHSENTAEWTFHNHHTSSPTAIPRNALAADLTDPEFAQPAVRTLSAVGRDRLENFGREEHSPEQAQYSPADPGAAASEPSAADSAALGAAGPAHKNGLRALHHDVATPSAPVADGGAQQGTQDAEQNQSAGGSQAAAQELHGGATYGASEGAKDDFLQHPDPDKEQRPSKRRRRAVTPHWEDVLLGVRTNTKRPRN